MHSGQMSASQWQSTLSCPSEAVSVLCACPVVGCFCRVCPCVVQHIADSRGIRYILVVSLDKQAAAAAFGTADVAVGIASGRPVATAVPSSSSRASPKRQPSSACARSSAAASHGSAAPPPPPPPLADAVLIDLLHCCLGMRRIAHLWLMLAPTGMHSGLPPGGTPDDGGSGSSAAAAEAAEAAEAAGGRLLSTAMSAMGVLAIAAVPAVAAAAEHAAKRTAEQAELSEGSDSEQPFQLVLQLLFALANMWGAATPQDLLPPLVEVGHAETYMTHMTPCNVLLQCSATPALAGCFPVWDTQYACQAAIAFVRALQDCCAVAAAAAAMDPLVLELASKKKRSNLDWDTLRGKMRAVLPASDRLRLQPMFQQV